MTARTHLMMAAIALTTLMATTPIRPAFAHGGEDHDHAADAPPSATAATQTGSVPRRLPDGGLWMPKPVQHQLGLRTQAAKLDTHMLALTLNGRVMADPNASGKVQATQAGRIEAGPKGLPLPGQQVQKGQVLAYLHPTANSMERGNQVAALAELEAQYTLAEGKLARYVQLEGAIPAKDIEAAREERDALRKRRAAIHGSLHAPEALRSPITGTLISAPLSIGQLVDARDVLFEVVDPHRLMVEALAYEPALAQGLGQASAKLPDGRTVALRHVGGGLRLQEQAMPLLFTITERTPGLAIGQPVQVHVSTSKALKGIAISRAALVRLASGEMAVWLHTVPEQFKPSVVRFQPLDATSVLVTEGIQPGERVVIEGASLLAQVR